MRYASRAVFAPSLVLVGIAGGLVYALSAQDPPEVAPSPVEVGAHGQDPRPGPDEEAVHQTLEAFVTAFNANDAAKVVATLSPTAEYIDDDSNRLEGTKAIGELFGKFFEENPGAKLQVTPSGARTVAPGVVVEDGESVVTIPEQNTRSVRKFTVVYARIGDAWKVASVREYPEEPEVISSTDRLKELEFLIGDWVHEGGDTLVATTTRKSPDGSCLMREFSVFQQGKELLTGMHRIAVDPLTGTVRGWSFDSGGGHGESTWTKNGDSWLVRASGVTSDGDAAAATYIITPLSKDRIELKTMHRVIGDTVEPDSTATLVRRVIVRHPEK